MEKIFNAFSIIVGFLGGIFTFLFGKLDILFYTLIALVVLDYITGLIKAVYTKTISSAVGKKGLLKKLMILIVIAVAAILNRVITELMPGISSPLREIAIVFYICNEGISILENVAEFLPIPEKIKSTLIQLRDKNKSDNGEEKGASTIKLSEFKNNFKNGKSYGWQGGYIGECVSLVKNYISSVLGITPQSIGNAKYYWLNRNCDYIKKNFNCITKGPAQPGDIFVRTTGTYGHVGIVLSANNKEFKTIEQNAGGSRVVSNKTHTYDDDIHFLRPKNQKNIDIKPAPVYKTTSANLHAYKGSSCTTISTTIPAGTKVELVNDNAGKFTKKGITYTKAVIKYKNELFYVAKKYLK